MGALARGLADVDANAALRDVLRGSPVSEDPLSRLTISRTSEGVWIDNGTTSIRVSWAELERIFARDGVPYPESLRQAIAQRFCLSCTVQLSDGEQYTCSTCQDDIREDLAALLDDLD